MSTTLTQHIMLPIRDLDCPGSDAVLVERALRQVTGVINAYVNPANEVAYVEYDPARTGVAKLITAIERSGFHPGIPVLSEH